LPWKKKLTYSLILLAGLWGAVELVCWGGLLALRRLKGIEYTPLLVHELDADQRNILEGFLRSPVKSYLMFSPSLGWTVRPGGVGRHGTYRANAAGVRGDRDYARVPPPGAMRIAVFGASAVHASDVPNPVAWEAVLERMDPHLEVMNFAVPGYGPDQAYLRYLQDGAAFRFHVVFFGLGAENIRRTVSVFRPFYEGHTRLPFSKPRFVLRRGRLERIDNPIQSLDGYRELLASTAPELERLGRYDDYFQQSRRALFDFLPSVRLTFVARRQWLNPPFREGALCNRDSEAYRLTAAILDAFHRDALAAGALPVIVFFPERNDLQGITGGWPPAYTPLLEDCRRKGYRTLDLLPGFVRYGKGARPQDVLRSHYSGLGNRIAAQWMLDSLRAARLDTPEGVETARRAEFRKTPSPGDRRATIAERAEAGGAMNSTENHGRRPK
jgi:hypothetical protein